jgi:hypothetical protein
MSARWRERAPHGGCTCKRNSAPFNVGSERAPQWRANPMITLIPKKGEQRNQRFEFQLR